MSLTKNRTKKKIKYPYIPYFFKKRVIASTGTKIFDEENESVDMGNKDIETWEGIDKTFKNLCDVYKNYILKDEPTRLE